MAAPETCPNCGEDLPPRARACPHCGADDRTGWSDRAAAERLGVPADEPFDHEAFVREEFGTPARATRPWWWWLIVLGVLLALASGLLLG